MKYKNETELKEGTEGGKRKVKEAERQRKWDGVRRTE